MKNENIIIEETKREAFDEPTCELVEFSFENVLATDETSPDIDG